VDECEPLISQNGLCCPAEFFFSRLSSSVEGKYRMPFTILNYQPYVLSSALDKVQLTVPRRYT